MVLIKDYFNSCYFTGIPNNKCVVHRRSKQLVIGMDRVKHFAINSRSEKVFDTSFFLKLKRVMLH